MPVPSTASALIFDPVEALEDLRQLVAGYPYARVADDKLGVIAVARQRHRNLAIEGELEGVGEEIEDDFLPHVPVDMDRLGKGRTVDRERQIGPLASRPEIAGEIRGESCEVDRLV